MIKRIIRSPDNRFVTIMLGFVKENLELLLQDRPIMIKGKDLGLGDDCNIIIMADKTHDDVTARLQKLFKDGDPNGYVKVLNINKQFYVVPAVASSMFHPLIILTELASYPALRSQKVLGFRQRMYDADGTLTHTYILDMFYADTAEELAKRMESAHG